MHPVAPETVVRQLEWRYAVKKFDAAKKIAAADWDALERALVLSPSSFGLQPWKFVVVSEPALREKLVAASWNQRQVADASHVVVFAAVNDIGPAYVDRYVARIAAVRGVSAASLDSYRKLMSDFVSRPKPQFDVHAWASLQIYIALGNFMTSAAMMGIDTCPMEGIVPGKYDEILGLGARGLSTVVVATAGYRSPDCTYASAKKVRFDREDVFVRM